MTTTTPGQPSTFVVNFRQWPPDGPLVDVTGLQYSVIRTDSTVIIAPTAVGIEHLATGVYAVTFTLSIGEAAGDALILWTANEGSASEQFTIGLAISSSTSAAACSTWDPVLCCPLSAESAMASGTALQAASDVLYRLSGQQFGVCTFVFRPCKANCASDSALWGGGFGTYGGGWWQWAGGGGWPRPFLFDGAWFNLTCGSCFGSCSCTPLSRALLPAPVHSIVDVKVDGVSLVPGVDYRVDNYRELIRLGGHSWPDCQDMSLPDTADNTWSVTAAIGQEVPTMGRIAVGELMCDLLSNCAGGPCVTPRTATNITRQGVTIDLPTIQEMLAQGFTGLRNVDLFVSTYNPNRLQAPPMVFDIDGENWRRTTWP